MIKKHRCQYKTAEEMPLLLSTYIPTEYSMFSVIAENKLNDIYVALEIY